MPETVPAIPAPVLDIAAISAAVPEGFGSAPLRDYYRVYYAVNSLPIAGQDKRLVCDLISIAIQASRDTAPRL